MMLPILDTTGLRSRPDTGLTVKKDRHLPACIARLCISWTRTDVRHTS